MYMYLPINCLNVFRQHIYMYMTSFEEGRAYCFAHLSQSVCMLVSHNL